jgi:hypothetical protein
VGPRDTLPEQQVYSHYQLMINDYYRWYHRKGSPIVDYDIRCNFSVGIDA